MGGAAAAEQPGSSTIAGGEGAAGGAAQAAAAEGRRRRSNGREDVASSELPRLEPVDDSAVELSLLAQAPQGDEEEGGAAARGDVESGGGGGPFSLNRRGRGGRACSCLKHLPLGAPRHAHRLLLIGEVPPILRCPGILTGYRERPFAMSWADIARSCGYLHNESGNIATHAAALLLFAAVAAAHFRARGAAMSASDAAVHALFFVGVGALCFGSVCFHVVFWRSEAVGVLLSAAGATNWTIHAGLACTPAARSTYFVVCNVLVALLLPAVFARRLRNNLVMVTPLFAAAGLLMLLPVAHALAAGGGAALRRRGDFYAAGAAGNLAMIALTVIGAAFFVSRWPEKRWPGRYDYWLHSHQWWHVATTAALLAHYAGHAAVFDAVQAAGGAARACAARGG